MEFLYIYLAVVNLISIIITVYDKLSARRGGYRIPEKVLMLFAALGGSPAMFLTMIFIRHKTRKPLFMAGIPLIFIIELIAAIFILTYGVGSV